MTGYDPVPFDLDDAFARWSQVPGFLEAYEALPPIQPDPERNKQDAERAP